MEKMERLKQFIENQLKAAGKSGVVVGVSGGIDSAVCCLLAVSALGSTRVYPLFMPHRAEHINLKKPIENMCELFSMELIVFELMDIVCKFKEETGCKEDLLLGNFAARIRTAFLYQHAAVTNSLVINTSNRTEAMLGYCTKWGDQVGDISPIGNLYKAEVYDLGRELGVPLEILEAVPSAGFYSGQEDEKELGISYRELDKIISYIDQGREKEIESDRLLKVKELIRVSKHKRCFPIVPERKSEFKS